MEYWYFIIDMCLVVYTGYKKMDIYISLPDFFLTLPAGVGDPEKIYRYLNFL